MSSKPFLTQNLGTKLYGDYVLAINTVETWSNVLRVKHFLVLLDCCSSGLAFSDKGGGQCDQAILRTLSGNGSRTVATAGTADQKTYALKARDGAGNGIFTQAFLNAFDNRMDKLGKCGLVTIDEILAQVKFDVADFSAKYKKTLTPRLWTMNENDYRGSFVFVNPKGGEFEFGDRQIASGQLVKKSGISTGERYGTIRVISQYDCNVAVDGLRGKITAGEAFVFFPVKIGKRTLKITGPGGFGAPSTRTVEVPFNAEVTVTLRNQFVSKTPGVSSLSTDSGYQLRANPKKLSKTDVKNMLKNRGYFCREYSWNKEWSNPKRSGTNISHFVFSLLGAWFVCENPLQTRNARRRGRFKSRPAFLNRGGYAGRARATHPGF